MSQAQVLDIMMQTMIVAFKLAGPILILSMLIGLIIAIFQAATQIHEQTLTFVPKLIIVGIVMLLLGEWMLTTLNDFFVSLMNIIGSL